MNEDIIRSVASDQSSVSPLNEKKKSTSELIITAFPGPFLWPHPLFPLASISLSLPLSWNVTALSSKKSEAVVCQTPLSELTCCPAKCHNFICAKFNNMTRWSFNNVAIWFLSFQFLILLSQYANANSHLSKVWTIFEQAWRLWNTIWDCNKMNFNLWIQAGFSPE